MSDREDEKRPNEKDVHVGSRIRLRRTMMGTSQEKLAERLGITFQQVQKYERGANRVSASRLHDIATVLEVPTSFFFDDMPGQEGFGGTAGFAEEAAHNALVANCTSQEGLQLNRAFFAIRDATVRRRIIELVRALSSDTV